MDKTQVLDLIHASELAEHIDLLTESLLPSARIQVHEDSQETDPEVSHFGGLPRLPHGVTWPVWDKREFLSAEVARLESQYRANPRATGLRDLATRMRKELDNDPVPLLFLGQLVLKEISAAAPIPGWPEDGVLLFFFDQSHWGFDPLASGHSRVFYYPPEETLTTVPVPKIIPHDCILPARRMTFHREWTLPTRISRDGIDFSEWDDSGYGNLCGELLETFGDDEPIHRCGGHPQEIQGEMRLECQLVTNGIYCGNPSGYQDPRRNQLEKGAADWQLLIQIDSDEKRIGWMWGDTGRVYFWARRQDISSANFEHTWAILQCY